MIPLSQANEKWSEKKRVRKPRKQTPKQRVKTSPLNTPWRYVQYGRQPYVVLCYASMRSRMRPEEREWFSVSDYHSFQEGRITVRQIGSHCLSLTKAGYLERRSKDGKFQYRFTQLGDYALRVIGQIENKRKEREAKRIAQRNLHTKEKR